MRNPLFILVPALLLAACAQEPAAPTAQGIDVGPNFNWMNNPDNGNLRITRYETDFAVSWTDPKNGLRATHTTFPIPFQGNPEADCGPQELLDPINEQDVGLPDFNDFLASWLRANATGSLWIIVRDLNTPGDCYGRMLVAQGMGAIRYSDNDVFAWYPLGESTRNNDNAWGYMAEGNLTGADGGTMQYSGHFRSVWDPQAGAPGTGGKNLVWTKVTIQ